MAWLRAYSDVHLLGDERWLQARRNTGEARVERLGQGWYEEFGGLDREDKSRVGRDCLICRMYSSCSIVVYVYISSVA